MKNREIVVVSNKRKKVENELAIIDVDKKYEEKELNIKEEIWYLRYINGEESEFSSERMSLRLVGKIDELITEKVIRKTKELKALIENKKHVKFNDQNGQEINSIKDFINIKEFCCCLEIGNLHITKNEKPYMLKIAEGKIEKVDGEILFDKKTVEQMIDEIEKVENEWKLKENPILNVYFSMNNKGKKVELQKEEIKKMIKDMKDKGCKKELDSVIEILDSKKGVESYFKIKNVEIDILETKNKIIIIETKEQDRKIEVIEKEEKEILVKKIKMTIEEAEVEKIWSLLY